MSAPVDKVKACVRLLDRDNESHESFLLCIVQIPEQAQLSGWIEQPIRLYDLSPLLELFRSTIADQFCDFVILFQALA